ncbi:hypothetical protein [Anaerovorax odorimutans]|uniref:hypothetical protein n=1 Tax=Anaerovorax odorimutans TaxID=109327 RepID=UPI000421AD98|nr:hypothetical protein [Anaerovorax odorimutans]
MRINSVNDLDLTKANINGMNSGKNTSSVSFGDILNEKTCSNSASELFQNLFSTYNVSCKVGNCNISHEDWVRNDFPSWKYFDDSTTADVLNSWQSSGHDVSSMDSDVLSSWKGTENRKMVIIIPDELASKMEADSTFADQVLRKVYLWQKNHSKLEKSLSEGYGYNGELSTFEDSYLLKLDKDGNVTDYVVTGPGYNESVRKDESSVSDEEINSLIKAQKILDKDQEFFQNNINKKILYDYTMAMGLIAADSISKRYISYYL